MQSAASWEIRTFEVPREYLCFRVEYYGDDQQGTGWAMEHLRRSFAHAWLEFTARGSPEPDVPETTWIAENHHRHRVARLQEDYRHILYGSTPVKEFPG